MKALAEIIEAKTRRQEYGPDDIALWLREGLLSRKDAALLQTFPDGRKRLAQAAEEYRQTWDCCKKEQEERARRVARLVAILGPDTPIDRVRHSDGERVKAILRARYKAVSVNKHLQDLKRLFTVQMAEGALEYHPFGVLRGAKVPREEKIEHTVLTAAQIEEVLARAEENDRKDRKVTPGDPPALGGNLTLFLLMFLGTGLRRKEAMAARLENINWQERCLRVVDTKNGEPRLVGLGQRLFGLLLPRKGKGGYILPRYHESSVSRAIIRHFARCGIKMRLHDTRHTYTTRLLDLGVHKHRAMGRTGHKDSRMLDHYTHPDFGEVYEDGFEFMQEAAGKEG